MREHLVKHWPGCYIPPIPPKKMTGNKGETFVEDRAVFLDRFMKQISKNPHLVNSDTFKVFARPSGEVEKVLNMHPKPTPENIVDRFKTVLHVDEFPDEGLVRNSRETINDFSAFCKRIAPVLMKIKKEARNWGPIKAHHNNSYKSLIELLAKYEEETLTTYCDSNANKLVVGDINDTELKEKAEELSTSLKNPFTEFYNWVRGECDDVEALYEAIRGRDRLVETKNKTEKQKKSDEGELEKLNQGKKTLKTLFKGSSGRQVTITNLTNNIAQAEKDIELFGRLVSMVEVYLAETVIPQFKEGKIDIYYQILKAFGQSEVANAHQMATFWTHLMTNRNLSA